MATENLELTGVEELVSFPCSLLEILMTLLTSAREDELDIFSSHVNLHLVASYT